MYKKLLGSHTYILTQPVSIFYSGLYGNVLQRVLASWDTDMDGCVNRVGKLHRIEKH